MSDPSMSPDEMAWAFQNAGRPPAARVATSEAFAAQAREREQALLRKNLEAQHAQDMQYNQAVHAQDMAAAQAHHRALMGQYSLLDQVKAGLGALNASEFGWKQGFVAGLVVGAVVAGIFGAWNRK